MAGQGECSRKLNFRTSEQRGMATGYHPTGNHFYLVALQYAYSIWAVRLRGMYSTTHCKGSDPVRKSYDRVARLSSPLFFSPRRCPPQFPKPLRRARRARLRPVKVCAVPDVLCDIIRRQQTPRIGIAREDSGDALCARLLGLRGFLLEIGALVGPGKIRDH